MRGFAEHTLPHAQAHLILAGPTVHTVTDDPEEPEVLDEVQAAWRALAHQQRCRVTVACLPMHDVEENAAIVNALQRHADVIVKKSLEEGFGLGVTEALWKRRAVVASDVGGHRDQIKHQHNGLLVDPTDPRASATRSQSCSPTRHERARSATPDTTGPGLGSRRRGVAHASRSSAAAFRPQGRRGRGPARCSGYPHGPFSPPRAP